MRKKLLSLFLSGVITIMSAATVFAADTTTDVNTPGTSDCTVTASLSDTYKVTIPLTIELEKQTNGKYSKDFDVIVKGFIASDKKVKVTNGGLTLSGSKGSSVPCAVTFTNNTWTYSETSNVGSGEGGTLEKIDGTKKSGNISTSAAVTYVDSYSGTLTFTIALEDA